MNNPDLIPIKTALISVSDKTGLLPLARVLIRQKVKIYSTGGTLNFLKEGGRLPGPHRGRARQVRARRGPRALRLSPRDSTGVGAAAAHRPR